MAYLDLFLVPCQISETKETFLSRDEDTSDHFVRRSGLEDVVEVVQADAVRLVQRLEHRFVEVDTLVNLFRNIKSTSFLLRHLLRLVYMYNFWSGL